MVMVLGVSDFKCVKCKNSGRISKADLVLMRPEILCDCHLGEIISAAKDLAHQHAGPWLGLIESRDDWMTRMDHERELLEIDRWRDWSTG